ncbi:MAG TPA: hypothetical protein EYQ66_06790 [Myxococcales bacterium]|nr:hypothetical protein [Myxococcales bacterium]HIL01668.1 hypothetical protein [Myxococcales bacterium]
MRPHEVFASMPSEHTTAFFTTLAQDCPGLFTQAVQAASVATKSRPQYLLRQPLDKRAAALRRVLARVASGPMAEEILASYFVDCRKEVLVAWLDRVGLKHEEGILKEESPESPAEAKLAEHVKAFLAEKDDPDRGLLLSAFGAQSAIDWPTLDALVQAEKNQT